MAKIPTTQTALVVQAIGKPLVSVSDWPVPSPGPKQVQVRVTVGALNPHDSYSRDIGLFIADDIPAVLGNDVVGEVTALGEGAKRYKVGDKVFGQGSMARGSRALQQYAVLDEDFSAEVPKGTSDDEAATLPSNIIADVVAFFDPTHLAIPAPWTGKTTTENSILIVGGGSNCGRFAVQLAHFSGFKTIVVVGGREAELRSYGATHVVDRHGGHEAVTKRIRDIVSDDLILAFDAVSAPGEQHVAINALSNSKTGKLARLRSSRGELQEALIQPKKAGYELKNVMGSSSAHADITGPFWKNLGDFLVQGKIKALEYATVDGLDADKANEVLDAYTKGPRPKQTHFHPSKI
ncbi:putative alcohol dehydrogenase [Paraphoma chrysanthemicola]|nr:putative alcohol dehydrogenase [Paraphoma chrysanthemicola]